MKILLAGLGSVGQRHARNLRTTLGDDVELLAYRVRGLPHVITPDLRLEPGADVESCYGVRLFTDLDCALAEKPDAVFVTNPNSLHMPVALAAARAGCHLFIEKPLSHTLEGIDELAALIERQRLVCLVGYQLRFHPGLRAMQSCLSARAIGNVVAARLEFGEYLPGWHPYEDYRRMPSMRPEFGGGLILAQIHDLDYAFALFGLPRSIFARGGHFSDLDVPVEDTVSVVMDCDVNGRRVAVQLHQDCLQRPATRTCEVIGDAGTMFLDFNASTFRVSRRDRPVESRTFEGHQRNQLFLDELQHFLACLRGEAEPIVPLGDAVQSLRMAMAVKTSMDTGAVVTLS